MSDTDLPGTGDARRASPARGRLRVALLVAGATLAGAALGTWALGRTEAPVDRHITIKARQYAYEPEIIEANRGDRLHVKLASLDVIHGFYLEGYDLDAEVRPSESGFRLRHPSLHDDWQKVDEVTVELTRGGKFRYRCSHTCGTMHPFMTGVLLVAPNRLLHAGLGGAAGLLAGVAIAFLRQAPHA